MSSSETPDSDIGPDSWLHFAGIGGSGMSGLAQFHALSGGTVTGSDRAFDQGQRQDIRSRLEDLGIEVDYVERRDDRLLAAVRIGGVRLIDNVPAGPDLHS